MSPAETAPADPYAAPPPPPSPAITPRDVLAQWKVSGPLVHEPTGLSDLDRLTGGGPIYGSRWYLLGAPDAGKTALLVQLAHLWAERGVAVGMLAVDEEPDDITTRLVQRSKFSRTHCEQRHPAIVAKMATAIADLPLRFYPPGCPIEAAAADLATFAKAKGHKRTAMFVDSVQQITCDALAAADREVCPRDAINANVKAIRAVATEHKMIVIATSEMNRTAYRSVESAEASNDMAAGKESGAIEYSARVMLSLRSVKDHPELMQVRMVKNKHGASAPAAADFFLKIDRASQTIEDSVAPEAQVRQGLDDPKFVSDCIAVWNIVRAKPGIRINALRVQVKAANLKMGHNKVDGILSRLENDRKIEARMSTPPSGGTMSAAYFAVENAASNANAAEPLPAMAIDEGDDDFMRTVMDAAE
jgi:hypothetical protein